MFSCKLGILGLCYVFWEGIPILRKLLKYVIKWLMKWISDIKFRQNHMKLTFFVFLSNFVVIWSTSQVLKFHVRHYDIINVWSIVMRFWTNTMTTLISVIYTIWSYTIQDSSLGAYGSFQHKIDTISCMVNTYHPIQDSCCNHMN